MCTTSCTLFDWTCIQVTLHFDKPAQTWALIACFGASFRSLPILIHVRLWIIELSPVPITLSKVSFMSIHILMNSCHFTLLAANGHISGSHYCPLHTFPYRLKVDGLSSREKCLGISLCISTEVTSSSSSIFFRICCYVCGDLGLCSTVIYLSPWPEDEWNIHFDTVVCSVILLSSSIARTLSEWLSPLPRDECFSPSGI